jgi:hypothetical protein
MRKPFSPRFRRNLVCALATALQTLLWASGAAAQASRRFNELNFPQYSYAQGAEQTPDGGYVVGANFCTSTCYLVLVAKLDSSGNIQWQKQYHTEAYSSKLYALNQTSDGGYVWCGVLQDPGSGAGSAIIVKLDPDGNIQWQQTYGTAAYATDVTETRDGGYIVAGVSPPSPLETVQGWIAKLDASGRVQWQRLLASSQSVTAESVIENQDDRYTLAGSAGGSVLVAEFDSGGGIRWQTLYSPEKLWSTGNSITETPDGGYMVGGYGNDSSSFALALKLSPGGTLRWAKTYKMSGTASQFVAVRRTHDGGYAFSGQFATGIGYYGGHHAWIVKTDSRGELQWQKSYGNRTCGAVFQRLDQADDGGFIGGGWLFDFNNQLEAYIVRTDSAGNVYNGSDARVTTATAASPSGASSPAKLTITEPADSRGSGTLSASPTSFILATQAQR